MPSHDITVWLLQYSYSETTMSGGMRIAVANGRADLAAGAFGDWHSFYTSPQLLGRPAGEWLDFPDLATSDGHLYLAANVFDANRSFTDSVVWRMPLAQVAAGGLATVESVSRGTIGGNSYRFAQNAAGTMYFAAHMSGSSLRAYRWPDSGNVSWSTIAVPSWTAVGMVALAPNGVNWGSRYDGRITGGYYKGGSSPEYGFLWSSAPISGRPRCFVRAVRISATSHALRATEDIWSSSIDALYPAAAANARGDIGVCFAIGSNVDHPTTAYLCVDSCRPLFSGQTFLNFTGNASPSVSGSWGDYFSMQRHAYLPNTFVATGMTLRGGGLSVNSEPHFVHFGREADQVADPVLTVQSAGVSAVPITLDVADINVARNGTTSFTRTFAAGQTYTVTAPGSRAVGGLSYVFSHWSWRSSPTGSLVAQQRGVLSFTANIGSTSDTVVANYELLAGLVVRSTNPSSGVQITVSPLDYFGNGNSTTPFTRSYFAGVVSLTAPATVGANPFRQWIVGGAPQPLGQRTVSVSLAQPGIAYIAQAVYANRVVGTFTAFGSSCSGSAGTPAHAGIGTPDVGTSVTYSLQGAAPFAAGQFYIGASNSSYLGLPLPLALDSIGVTGCSLYVSGDISVPFSTGTLGDASFNLQLPNSPALIATHLYTQALFLDVASGRPTPLTLTHGLDTQIGGLQ